MFSDIFTIQESICIFNWFYFKENIKRNVLLFILDISLLSLITFQLVFEGVCKKGHDCDIGIANIEILPTQCPDTWQKGKCNK